ncbi:hypothetical protein Goari_001102 [Gossypium aridum]|uniref:Uncharacterized protein n=1 Tax=Gossypium aridum TaxID=34290 RepID=A0A7J8YKF7_GOSAI|nr:hypothetical protein [Gossypium aridum]
MLLHSSSGISSTMALTLVARRNQLRPRKKERKVKLLLRR